ncbi:MAG: hypothetical protein ACREGG_04395, partial [Candidatus Saccharimonadales bacterium]
QLSAAKYGRPKAQVDAEINQRLKTIAPPRPSFGSSSPFGSPSNLPPGGFPPPASRSLGPAPNSPTPALKPPASGSSFLDEWLAKRQASDGTPPVSRPSNNPPAPKPQNQSRPAEPVKELPKAQPQNSGEFVIDRDIDPAQHQSQVVHIDKDGNLSFDS